VARAFRSIGIACGLASSLALAQTQPPPTASVPPPFTTQIKKAVVFIQTDCRTPQGVESHVGTGFILSVRDAPRLPADWAFTYLITNRHVVQPGIEDSKPCDVVGSYVRLNLRAHANDQPGSRLVPLGDLKNLWSFPTDDSVDLAALLIALDEKLYDFMTVPFAMLSDQKSDALTEGDAVLFTGLFIQYMGQTRMQPIVRSGSLAMLPDETLLTTLKKPGHVYLAEVHAFGGNSGSPMFVDVAGLRRGKLNYEFKLLGVVSGEVYETADFQLQVATTYKGDVSANSGISTVVPAGEIKALLESSDVQKKRDEAIAREKPTRK